MILPLMLGLARAQHPRHAFHEVRLERSGDAGPLTCILQDRQGYIWIGGRHGLWRLSSRNVERVPVPVSRGAPSPHPHVEALAEDPEGEIWAFTIGGLLRFDSEQKRMIPTAWWRDDPAVPHIQSATDLLFDRTGMLWLGTLYGKLIRFDPRNGRGEITRLHDRYCGKPSHVRLMRRRNGGIRVTSPAGYGDLDDLESSWRDDCLTERLDLGDVAPRNLRMIPGRDGLWVAADHRLWRLDHQDRRVLRGPVELPRVQKGEAATVMSLTRDARGRVWIATTYGLMVVEPAEDRAYVPGRWAPRERERRSEAVLQVLLDRSGALWTLSPRRVSRCDVRSPMDRFDPRSDLGFATKLAPRGLLIDELRRIWFVNLNRQLLVLDRRMPRWLIPLPDRDHLSRARAIAQGDTGRSWVATGGHLVELDQRDFSMLREIALPAENADAGVTQALHYHRGQLWIGCTKGLLLHELASGTTRRIPLGPGRGIVPGGIRPGRDGRLWLCRIASGLNWIDPQTEALHRTPVRDPRVGQEPVKSVFDVHDPGAGPLFLATGAGVLVLDLATGRTRRARFDGQEDTPTITSLVPDSQGRVWAGTSRDGIRLVNSQGTILRKVANRVSEGTGRLLIAARCRGPDGELAFGTQDGILAFDPDAFGTAHRALELAVTDFRVDGATHAAIHDRPPESRVELGVGKSNLEFRFSAFDFTAPRDIEYGFRLEGWDTEWISCLDEPMARYTNLPPGDYRFHVRARHRGEAWVTRSWPHEIVIPPRLIDRWWVRSLIAATLLSAILVYALYAHRLASQGRKLEAELRERQRAEGEAQELSQKLEQSQKMEAVGRLAGGVAHDFNNILTAIIARIELARDELDQPGLRPDELGASLDEIEASAMRAARLTGQLLAFSRRQPSSPRTLDLTEVVRSMESMLRPLLREDIELVLDVDERSAFLTADRSQIEQVILNLCVNGSDAMPRGGTLTVATRRGVSRTGETTRLEVRDTGVGMEEAIIHRACDPFFTTKPVGEGSGLGLSMVHGIVSQAHGEIEIRSAPGQGTTVGIEFPAVDAPPAEVAPGEPEELDDRAHETVLLCEDDPDVRELTRRTLTRHGYEVLPAASPGEAVRIATKTAKRIDLLLTDVIMPGMNGLVLARLISRTRPPLPVLFMSGYTADVLEKQRLRLEDIDLLEKPFRPRELLGRVRAAIMRTPEASETES